MRLRSGDLAEFIAAVRAITTRGRTFTGRGRGGDLSRLGRTILDRIMAAAEALPGLHHACV